MKNNKKKTRMTKIEKRRLAFEKRNVKKEQDRARYGAEGGSALVMAKTTEFNRRVIAAVLALVFVLTTIVVGYNFAAKADDPDDGFKMFESIDDSGFVTRKGIKLDDKGTTDTTDDTYDLRMEAYATAPIATKPLDTETPLDIVMVMDQSGSMRTGNGVYTRIGESEEEEFTINAADGKYYLDPEDNKYYQLKVDHTTSGAYTPAPVSNSSENVINTWTAVSANQVYNRLGSLYYYTGTSFENVKVKKTTKYSAYTSNLDMGHRSINHDDYGPRHITTNYYVYVPHNPNDIDEISCWHRVYYQEYGSGVISGSREAGYYYTFYYYTNSTEGSGASTITSGNKGDILGSGDAQITLLCDHYECACKGYLGFYWEDTDIGKKYWTNSTGNGTDGNLYTENGTSSYYNYLYTTPLNSTKDRVLACQEPSTNYSHTYEGNLYTQGYRLYYNKEGVADPIYVGNAVYNRNDIAYKKADNDDIPLYEGKNISRLEAMKRAASQLITKLGETDIDARVSLVGFTDAGSVLTTPDLIAVKETDSDTSHVDELNSIIDSITVSETNGSNLASGLNAASSVFSNDTANKGSRKRIVVVFTDVQPNEDNNSWVATKDNVFTAGSVLKDTYNASIYTVGICINDDDTQTDLEKLSSKYFKPIKDGALEISAGDNTAYYFNITSLESTEMAGDTLMDTVYSITQTLQSPYTSVALNDANSILKDIISDNFEFPDNFTEADKLNNVSIETAAVDNYPIDGDLQWDASETANYSKAWEGKTLTVDGFDYNFNYVSAGRDEGQKIIVTISGLKLKKNAQADPSRRIYSNDEESGIYKKGKEETLFAAFPRPYVDKTSDLVPSGTSGTPENGVVLNKYLTAKENGNYDLTLEAYSTSKNEKVTTKEKIPTDFVVVVDQSGSMDTKDMPADDPIVQNNLYLEDVANGQYYYKDGDNYYRVYGVKDYLYRYYPANYWFTGDIVEHLGADIGWFMGETDATTNIANAFYFREVVNGNTYYIPIKTTIQGKIGTYYMRFSYPSKQTGGDFEFNREETTYSSNGNSPWYKNVLNGDVMTSGGLWATANAAVQTLYPNDNAYTYSTINLLLARPRTGMYVNYPMYGRHLAYTKLCYRDESGAEHEVPSDSNGRTTWEYCDDDGIARSAQAANSARPTYSGLYKYNRYIDRISALKGALNEFAKAVANEEDDFGAVDNRISIVGFSSDGYNNTELLTSTRDDFAITSGGYISADYPNNYNGVSISAADAPGSGWYESALVNACDTDEVGAPKKGDVNDDILEAINALTPYGGTQPEDGLNMAHQILTKRSKTTYTIRSGKDKDNPVDRNTVVIFFTDGRPGNYHESNQYTEANDVVQAAHNIKGYKNTSLFSIGVFGESDGNPLTYDAKNERDSASGEIIRDIPRAQWKYLGGWMETYQTGGTYYCLRRQWRPNGADGYTETANDTIFDYMSVVSSNYPTAENYIAPEWLAGNFNGNYEDATDGVRHKDTAEATNKYYRMASSQETLIEAFMQAITMTSQEIEGDGSLGVNTILRDILNNGTFEMTGNTDVVLQTAKGKADANGVVDFDAPEDPSDDASDLHKAKGDKQVDVWGFDYSTNSIYHGKPEDNEHGLSEHQGRKLIVTLTNIVPNNSITSEGRDDPRLFSNNNQSGLFNNNNPVAYFPKPAITRHSYTMDVGNENDKAQFEVTTTLVKVSGATDDLSDVVLVNPDGTRLLYSTLGDGDKTFTMGKDQTFYYENVPVGYLVKTSLKAPDSFYEYSFWANHEANKVTLSTKYETERNLDYSDNVLHVTSESRYRTVTLAESVSGPYALTSDLFSVNLTLTPPDDTYTEPTIALASDVTLTRNSNGQYEGSVSDLPGNQNEKELRVPAGWTLKVEPVEHDKYDVESDYPKYNTNVSPTQTSIPPDGVVINRDLTNIFINNISKEITVEGIFNSNGHNWIIYILVGIAAIAVIAGGIFLWKKKDEFVEQ